MLEDSTFESVQKIRGDLIVIFRQVVDKSLARLKIKMDEEIEEELRERIAVLIFNELVNDMPITSYLAVWEDGAAEIVHAYLSPRFEILSGYSSLEIEEIGYHNLVRGDIIRFYREESGVEERVKPISEAKRKRINGFMDSRKWEGCYRIEKKNGKQAWVIDRSTITRFRNTLKDNIICLSSGILLETTELMGSRNYSL